MDSMNEVKRLLTEIDGLQSGKLMAHADGSVEDINVGDDEHNVFVEIPQEDECTLGPDCKCDECKKETEFNANGGADR